MHLRVSSGKKQNDEKIESERPWRKRSGGKGSVVRSAFRSASAAIQSIK